MAKALTKLLVLIAAYLWRCSSSLGTPGRQGGPVPNPKPDAAEGTAAEWSANYDTLRSAEQSLHEKTPLPKPVANAERNAAEWSSEAEVFRSAALALREIIARDEAAWLEEHVRLKALDDDESRTQRAPPLPPWSRVIVTQLEGCGVVAHWRFDDAGRAAVRVVDADHRLVASSEDAGWRITHCKREWGTKHDAEQQLECWLRDDALRLTLRTKAIRADQARLALDGASARERDVDACESALRTVNSVFARLGEHAAARPRWAPRRFVAAIVKSWRRARLARALRDLDTVLAAAREALAPFKQLAGLAHGESLVLPGGEKWIVQPAGAFSLEGAASLFLSTRGASYPNSPSVRYEGTFSVALAPESETLDLPRRDSKKGGRVGPRSGGRAGGRAGYGLVRPST